MGDLQGCSWGLLEVERTHPGVAPRHHTLCPPPAARTHPRTHKPIMVLCLLQTLPPLLAEFSARALDPLRAVKHGLMPWLE